MGDLEFDKTRSAIGVGDMSEEERRQMLEKFRSSGGEILNEKDLTSEQKKQKNKHSGRSYLSADSGDLKNKREYASYKEGNEGDSDGLNNKSSGERASSTSPKTGFLDLFFLNLRCVVASVSPFSSSKINHNFLKFLAEDFQEGAKKVHLNINLALMGKREEMNDIMETLNGRNPLFAHILDALHSFYESSLFFPLQNAYQENSSSQAQLDSIIDSIRVICKKLYQISPYKSQAVKAVNQFFQLYKKISDDPNAVEPARKEILKNMPIFWGGTLKNLHLLICRFEKKVFDIRSKTFLEEIGYLIEDSLMKKASDGNIPDIFKLPPPPQPENGSQGVESTELESTEPDSAEKSQEEEETDPVLKTQEYKYGMSLMKKLTPKKLKEKYDLNHKLKSLNEFDKAFLAYLCFLEFDNEYSFILVTKQIKYNVDYFQGKKRDFAVILSEVYNNSRKIERMLEEYRITHEDYVQIRDNPLSNYIEQNKKENQAKLKMENESMVIRSTIGHCMHEVVMNLATLINDMKTKKNIITDMDEVIHIRESLEGIKRLNNKTVLEAITETYCYALALKYRTGKSDLYGGYLDVSDKDIEKIYGAELLADKKEISGLSQTDSPSLIPS